MKLELPRVTVNLLTQGEVTQLAKDYMAQYSKTLTSEQIQYESTLLPTTRVLLNLRVFPVTSLIAQSHQSRVALYLRTLLEELRLFGSFEKLTDRIRFYLSANTALDLFHLIFKRLADDFQKVKTSLVIDTLRFITISRRGLTESELLQLLDVPFAIWSPFFNSLSEFLINRSETAGFLHFSFDLTN